MEHKPEDHVLVDVLYPPVKFGHIVVNLGFSLNGKMHFHQIIPIHIGKF